MMRKVIYSLVFCLCFYTSTVAQKINPKYTFNVELGLPVSVTNPLFGDVMQGLVNVSPYAQYSFPFHFHFGAGVKYSYFTINEFSVPEPRLGGVHSAGGFLKLGWDKFHSDRFATDLGVKMGYNQSFFSSYQSKGVNVVNVQVGSSLIEATVGFVLTSDEQNSYRWIIGYGVQGKGFQPEHIGLSSNGGYDPASFNTVTSYLLVGFGYTHYFKGKN
ncbi:MAG: hypothetical protein MK066_03505 [Crocinitomicaceae bacterium]|nr:hypothetical protein [Crocinitomicaceae bacterium]